MLEKEGLAMVRDGRHRLDQDVGGSEEEGHGIEHASKLCEELAGSSG